MNKQKCDEYLYTQFLLTAQDSYTCTELEKVAPEGMAHDSPTRLLAKQKLTPKVLWKNVAAHVDMKHGVLVVDDSVIDKPKMQKLGLARWQYSGAHHDVVKGIGLTTLLWTQESNQDHIPVDYRLYDPDTDGKTKNQHFQEMAKTAAWRGFTPEYVLFDSWYTSLENLKTVRALGWHWMGQMRKNRIVSTGPHEQTNLENIIIPAEGRQVHLRGYGLIKVFKSAANDSRVEYYGTSNTNLTAADVERIYGNRWQIEEYHRGLKQQCGIAKCQARTNRSQRNHIWASIHAFVILELNRKATGMSWQEAKRSIVRHAVQQYLLKPRYGMVLASA